MTTLTTLGELITPAKLRRAGGAELPILSMTMHGGLVDQANKFKKRVASADTSLYKRVLRNQLVVGFPIDEGVLSFQKLYDEAIVSPAYDIWDVRASGGVDVSYLERCLRSPRALAFYRSKLQGTTARRRTLPDDVFLSLRIPLPPLEEQKRIANILDKVDCLCRKRQEAIQLTGDFARAVFLEMFGDPVTNPKGWSVGTIGDATLYTRYGPRFHDREYAEQGAHILRTTDMGITGELCWEKAPVLPVTHEELFRFQLKPGTLLVTRTGATIGKVSLFRGAGRPCIAGAYLIEVGFNERVLPEYVLHYLLSEYGQSRLIGGSRAVAQPNLNAPTIRSIPLLLPPLEVQTEFVNRLRVIERMSQRQSEVLYEMENALRAIQTKFLCDGTMRFASKVKGLAA